MMGTIPWADLITHEEWCQGPGCEAPATRRACDPNGIVVGCCDAHHMQLRRGQAMRPLDSRFRRGHTTSYEEAFAALADAAICYAHTREDDRSYEAACERLRATAYRLFRVRRTGDSRRSRARQHGRRAT